MKIKKDTWLNITIQAMEDIGGYGHLEDIKKQIKIIANEKNKKITPKWDATIRKVIEEHSSDSANFNKRKDIFYSKEGIGKGVWGIRE